MRKESFKFAAIILAGIFLMALLAGVFYFQANPSQTVTVAGNSVLKVEPDLVVVYFNIDTQGETAKLAKDENALIVDEVVVNLIKLGLNRGDIDTQNFNIYPDYNWSGGRGEIIGYKASHTLKVELSDSEIDSVGSVIDAGVDAGASINYLNFELSQDLQNQYKLQALEKATEDAKIKAEGIARGLGKRLGRIVSVSGSDFQYYPWPIYAGEDVLVAKEAVTNIQPGEQEVSGSVSAVYALS